MKDFARPRAAPNISLLKARLGKTSSLLSIGTTLGFVGCTINYGTNLLPPTGNSQQAGPYATH